MAEVSRKLFVDQLDARCAVCGKMLGFRKMFAGEMFLCIDCEELVYDMTMNFHKRMQMNTSKKSTEQRIVPPLQLFA
jgi:hypothetical protein